MLEPRFFQRADVDLEASIVIGSITLAGRVVNLSESGALVELPKGAEPATPVRLTISITGKAAPLDVCGVVVRCVSGDDDHHHVAVSFEDVDDGTAAVLRGIVEKANNMAWDGAPGRIPREVAVRFVPLIRRLARGLVQRLPPQVSIDDLVGAGFVALVELYAKNPHASLSDLERVTLPRIRWAMLDELRNADPLSRRMRQRARRIAKAARDLQHETGEKPSHADVQARLGLTREAYDTALRLTQNGDAMSIDATEDFELPDRHNAGPEETLQHAHSLARLRTALDALPPRLKRVLELYYGDELTLRQIGNILGVTEARISQLVSDAVRRMRVTCVEDEKPPRPKSRKRAAGKGSNRAAA